MQEQRRQKMGDFKMIYPTVGTSALKASADPIAHATANIVEFPGTQSPSSTHCAQKSQKAHGSTASLQAKSVSKQTPAALLWGFIYTSTNNIEGKEFENVSKLEAMVGVIAICAILIAAAFISI